MCLLFGVRGTYLFPQQTRKNVVEGRAPVSLGSNVVNASFHACFPPDCSPEVFESMQAVERSKCATHFHFKHLLFSVLSVTLHTCLHTAGEILNSFAFNGDLVWFESLLRWRSLE